MNRGQAFTCEFAELCKGFCFTMRDGTDSSPVTVDAVTEIVLAQRGPTIADDFAKVSIGLRIADYQRSFDLKAKTSWFASRASEVNDHVVQRFAKVALLHRDTAHHPVVNSRRKCLREKRGQVEGCNVAFVGKACAPGQFRRLRQRWRSLNRSEERRVGKECRSRWS